MSIIDKILRFFLNRKAGRLFQRYILGKNDGSALKRLYGAGMAGMIPDPGLLVYHAWPAVFIAFKRNDAELVRLLLERGADVNAVADDGGNMITVFAPENSDPDLYRFLADRGIDLNNATSEGVRPVHVLVGSYCAAMTDGVESSKETAEDYRAIIADFLGRGMKADPEGAAKGVVPPLFRAAGADCVDMVKLLLAHGADKTRTFFSLDLDRETDVLGFLELEKTERDPAVHEALIALLNA